MGDFYRIHLLLFFVFQLFSTSLLAAFVQVNESGFGSSTNQRTEALISFKGKLLAGTYNFNGCRIFLSSDGHHWTNVVTNGFGDMQNQSVKSFVVFNGMVYASLENGSTGPKIFRSADGLAWQDVSFPIASAIAVVLSSNKGKIVAGVITEGMGQSRIFVSDSGDPFTWFLIPGSFNGFGNPNNHSIHSFAEFGGKTYAGVANWNGSSIYSSANLTNWVYIDQTTNGFNTSGWPRPNRILALENFSGFVYAGGDDGSIYRTSTGITWVKVKSASGMGMDQVNDLVVRSNMLYVATVEPMVMRAKLIRSKTGSAGSWEDVNKDGWGNAQNQRNMSLAVYSNALFVGTYNFGDGTAIHSDLIFDYLHVKRYADTPFAAVPAGTKNVPIFSFRPTDMKGDVITSIRLRDAGTSSNIRDLTNLRIWRDNNSDALLDNGDTLVSGISYWESTSNFWVFSGLAVASDSPLLVTADIKATAKTNSRIRPYLRGKLHEGDITCINGGMLLNNLTNLNSVLIGDYIRKVELGTAYPPVSMGYATTNLFSLKIVNSADFRVNRLVVRNLGTMSNGDVSSLSLYYDGNANGALDLWPIDNYIMQLNYDPGQNAWIYESGTPWPPMLESNTNFLLRIATSQNGKPGKTFNPLIRMADLKWEDGSFNLEVVSNQNPLTRIDEIVPQKLSDRPTTNLAAGSLRKTMLHFEVNDFYKHNLKRLRVTNAGTAQPFFEIQRMELYRDADLNGAYSVGDVLIRTAGYNSLSGTWNFTNFTFLSGTNYLVTVDIAAIHARHGKTIQVGIPASAIICSNGVLNNASILNPFQAIITNSFEVVSLTSNAMAYGASYTVSTNVTNRELLAFNYFNSKTAQLKELRLSNLGSMVPPQAKRIRIWNDQSPIGTFGASDLFIGNLTWDGISRWTNLHLSVAEGVNILLTLDTGVPYLAAVDFRASFLQTNDVRSVNLVAANRTLTNRFALKMDVNPPVAVSNITFSALNNSLFIAWDSVTNADLRNYLVAYDVVSHLSLKEYPGQLTTSNPFAILNLAPNMVYYFRVVSRDWAGNVSALSKEFRVRTGQVFARKMTKVIPSGFGDTANNEISVSAKFGGQSYIGVSRSMFGQGASVRRSTNGGKWQTVVSNGFGSVSLNKVGALEIFKGMIYAGLGTSMGAGNIHIIRSVDGKNWSTSLLDGVSGNNSREIRSMTVFSNWIFAGTYNWTDGGELWYSSDGIVWNNAVLPGFGDMNNQAIDSLAAFNGKIYAGTKNGWGSQLWSSANGTLWTKVAQASNGFGNSQNQTIVKLSVFNGYLVASTENFSTGGEIWISQDGVKWVRNIYAGFANTANQRIGILSRFSNRLVAGTYRPTGAAQLWQTANLTNWNRFQDDGFGDTDNNSFLSFFSLPGSTGASNFFVGTGNMNDGGEIWSDRQFSFTVMKNSDVLQSSDPGTRLTVMDFRISDDLGFGVSELSVRNLGSLQTNEIASVRLWYDNDLDGKWSGPDSAIGTPAVFNALDGLYKFYFLGALPERNLVLTADLKTTALEGRTFVASIGTNQILSESGARNGTSAITNLQLTGARLSFPVLTNLFPAQGTVRVATNSILSLLLMDNVDVVSQSIVFRLQNQSLFSNGNPMNGSTAVLSRTNKGWKMTIDPSIPMQSFSSATCIAVAADPTGNTTIKKWDFQTLDVVRPQTISLQAPLSNRKVNSNPVDFRWLKGFDVGSGISNYSVSISTDVGFLTGTNVTLVETNLSLSLSDDLWYWRVRSKDKHTNEGDWSTIWNFHLDTTSPTPVSLLTPSSNAWTNGNPVFSWNASADNLSGISNYRLEISSNILFTPINTVAIVNQTNYQRPFMFSDGIWYWRVVAIDRHGNESALSSQYQLNVDWTAPLVSNPRPVDQGLWPDELVRFAWDVVETGRGVKEYKVKFDTDQNLGNGYESVRITNLPQTEFLFSNGTTNHWAVWVSDLAGNTNFYGPWRFTVDTNIPIALLHEPVGIAMTNLRPQFAWSASSQGDTNILQVSTNGFSTLLLQQVTMLTSIQSPLNLPEGTNEWRIVSHKMGTSSWYTSSSAWFLVDRTPPPLPLLHSHTNNGWISSNVTFFWSPVYENGSGFDRFEVELGTNLSFSPVWKVTNLSATNFSIGPLPPTALSFFRIRSVDQVGNTSAFSVPLSLRQDRTAPATVQAFPADNDQFSSSLISFQWSATDTQSGLLRNSIEFDTNKDFVADFSLDFSTVTVQTSALFRDGTTNRWRVVGVDNVGNMAVSGWRQFQIRTNLPIPQIHYPIFGEVVSASRVLDFRWSDKNVETNIIQLSTNAGFVFRFIDLHKGTLTNHVNTTTPLPDGIWYLRILTVSGGTTNFSPVVIFRMQYVAPPPVPGEIATSPDASRIYPNPLYYDEYLRIDRLPENAEIGIYTLKGVRIWKRDVRSYDGFPIAEWKDLNIATGIYFVVITDDKGGKSVKKLVYLKERRNGP